MRKAFLLLTVSFAAASMAQASTIELLSGQKVQGEVLSRTDTEVVVDIKGRIETFYLGELTAIDGQAIEIQAPSAAEKEMPAASPAPAKVPVKPIPAAAAAPVSKPAAPIAAPAVPAAAVPPVIHGSPKVIPTADGGIIVVSRDKIIKYDKDLHAVKEVPVDSAAAK